MREPINLIPTIWSWSRQNLSDMLLHVSVAIVVSELNYTYRQTDGQNETIDLPAKANRRLKLTCAGHCTKQTTIKHIDCACWVDGN